MAFENPLVLTPGTDIFLGGPNGELHTVGDGGLSVEHDGVRREWDFLKGTAFFGTVRQDVWVMLPESVG